MHLYYRREDPRDAVVMKSSLGHFKSLSNLPSGAVIGTSAVRRAAQIRSNHPNLVIKDVRGNLNTRLKKLDSDEGEDYSALLLAAAGVTRMGWSDRISSLLDSCTSLHAVGQGALGVECREGDADVLEAIGVLSHRETMLPCIAERAFMRELDGGCSAPVAAHAQVHNTWTYQLQCR
jgi:hydroxymethylbilane synthase